MAGLVSGVADVAYNVGGFMHGHRTEKWEGGIGIGDGVDGFYFAVRAIGLEAAFAGGAAIEELGVLFLDEGGIEEHGVAEIAGGGGGEDGAVVAL